MNNFIVFNLKSLLQTYLTYTKRKKISWKLCGLIQGSQKQMSSRHLKMKICQGSARWLELCIEGKIQKYRILRLVQVDVLCNKV